MSSGVPSLCPLSFSSAFDVLEKLRYCFASRPTLLLSFTFIEEIRILAFLEPLSLIELSVMMEMFCICAFQYGSLQPCMAT